MNAGEFIDQFTQLSLKINNSFTSAEAVKKSKEELYDFLDANCETYINLNSRERNDVREAFRKLHTSNESNNFLNLLLLGYIQRSIENMELAGEKMWLVRGLIVTAMEDGIRDHRDNVNLLAHLFVAAEEKGLSPEVEFQKMAEIANDRPSLPGSTPMSQIILEIPATAHKINEERKKYL